MSRGERVGGAEYRGGMTAIDATPRYVWSPPNPAPGRYRVTCHVVYPCGHAETVTATDGNGAIPEHACP